jgi:hypothetical protein
MYYIIVIDCSIPKSEIVTVDETNPLTKEDLDYRHLQGPFGKFEDAQTAFKKVQAWEDLLEIGRANMRRI